MILIFYSYNDIVNAYFYDKDVHGMGNRRGRRIEESRKLNKKKVFTVILTIAVIIMMIISLKRLLSGEVNVSKDVSTLTTYFSAFQNEKWGVIDNKGNLIISPSYDNMIIIPDKNKAFFVVIEDANFDQETYKVKILNEKNEELLSDFDNLFPLENSDSTDSWYEANALRFMKDGKYGLIDFDGKIIIEPLYDNLYVMPGIKRVAVVEKDGKKGLVDITMGETIIDTQYDMITPCTDDIKCGYIVKDSNNKYGLVGHDKKQVLECKYDEIKNVASDTYYCVRENNKLEIVNSLGQVIVDNGFDDVKELNSENFVIVKDGKYGVMSVSGDIIIEPGYEEIKYAFNNFYIAKKDGKYGIMDSAQTSIIEYKYNNIFYIKEADFFEAERDDLKTDIIDSGFNIALTDIIVSELNKEDGYIRVREEQEYKYYNFKLEEKTNKEVLSTKTLYLVKEFGKYGYENKKGERVVDCKYDDANEQNDYGYCAVKKDGKWGVLKSDGSILLEPSINLDNNLIINFIADWYRINDSRTEIYTK